MKTNRILIYSTQGLRVTPSLAQFQLLEISTTGASSPPHPSLVISNSLPSHPRPPPTHALLGATPSLPSHPPWRQQQAHTPLSAIPSAVSLPPPEQQQQQQLHTLLSVTPSSDSCLPNQLPQQRHTLLSITPSSTSSYARLGQIEPVHFLSFAHQIASGMVREYSKKTKMS